MRIFGTFFAAAVASAAPQSRPFDALRRQSRVSADPTRVDLGYGIYEGVHNETTGLNVFKGRVLLHVWPLK